MTIRNLISTFAGALSASALLVSVASAGPVGRDMDRDFEGSLKVPQSEQAVNPADLRYVTRPSAHQNASAAACFDLVVIHQPTGREMMLESCLAVSHMEMKEIISTYRADFQRAYSEGRRMGFGAEMTSSRDAAEERADRRQMERTEFY